MKSTEEICRDAAQYVKRQREMGYDYDALFISNAELKERLSKHLGVEYKPIKTFQVRLFNALMEKYGKENDI